MFQALKGLPIWRCVFFSRVEGSGLIPESMGKIQGKMIFEAGNQEIMAILTQPLKGAWGVLLKCFTGKISPTTDDGFEDENFFPGIFGVHPVRPGREEKLVTTKIMTFLVGDPYKPSFATVVGWEGKSNQY